MSNNDQILQALHGADTILKGGASAITIDELEDAVLKLAASRRREGESDAQSLARLLDERDADLTLITKALDQLRVFERPPDLAADLVAKAERLIDDYVQTNKRADEAPEQAYSRLASGDRTFAELYEHLSKCRDAAG